MNVLRSILAGTSLALLTSLGGVAAEDTAARTLEPGPAQAGKDASNANRNAQPPRMGPREWEWWNDAEIQKALPLSADKVRRINDLYTHRVEELQPIVEEFQKQLVELDKMTRARVVNDSDYTVQVMRVESLRSELNKSRTVMLYRLMRMLSPEQYSRLQEIRDRRAGPGHRTPGSR